MKGIKDKIRQNKFLRWFLLLSNWLFQGILNADKTEKVFKVLFTVLFSTIFFLVLFFKFHQSFLISIFVGFIVGHTLNWILNNNITGILIHRLYIFKLEKKNAFRYLDSIAHRISNKTFALYATTHGSICRGALKPSSDIDIALVRKPGFINSLKSLWFVFLEKKIADAQGVPLEIYICDTPENAIKRFSQEQNPVVIYDSDYVLDKYYKEKLSLTEAKKLNGL